MSAKQQYDVVVIGAGMGGLIAGAMLAVMEGMKVLVLEKNSEIGGRVMSFGKQHGTDYSASEMEELLYSGAWSTIVRSEPAFPKIIEKGILKDYIIDGGWHAMSGGDRCRYALVARALGKRLPVSNCYGMGYWQDGKWLQLPELVKGWPERSIKERARVAQERMLLSTEEAAEYDQISLKMYLESITDDKLVQDYYIWMGKYQTAMANPNRISAGEWIKCNNGTAAVGRHLIAGGGMGEVTGGFKTVATTFASIIQEHGGEVRTGQTVTEIIIEDWKAKGVVVKGKDGTEEILASHVVCNAPIYALPKLIPEKYFPQELLQRVKDMYPSTAILGIMSLKEPLEKDYPTAQMEVPLLPGIEAIYPTGAEAVFGFEQVSMTDPSRAPKDRCLVEFALMTDPEDVKDAQLVQKLCDLILQWFRSQYPRFDEIMDWYWFTKCDMVWGVAVTPEFTGERRFPVKHPVVRGLFFTGDDVEQWDVGSNGAAHGAVLCVSALTGRDYLKILPPYWR